MRSVTSHYFKNASSDGFVELTSYWDCDILAANVSNSEPVTGVCKSAKSKDGLRYQYVAYMNFLGGIDHFSTEVGE